MLGRQPSIFETTSVKPLVETTKTLKEDSNQFVATSLARPLVEAAITSEEGNNQFFFLFHLFLFCYYVSSISQITSIITNL